MKEKTAQTKTYWLAAHAGSKDRNLGIVMVAGYDAPDCIRGTRIFYRLLRWAEDLYVRRDRTIGFSKAAFDYVTRDMVRFIVTYATEECEMNIAPINAFTFECNYGQGLQKRAFIDHTAVIKSIAGLRYPTALERRFIEDENGPLSSPPILQPRLF